MDDWRVKLAEEEVRRVADKELREKKRKEEKEQKRRLEKVNKEMKKLGHPSHDGFSDEDQNIISPADNSSSDESSDGQLRKEALKSRRNKSSK